MLNHPIETTIKELVGLGVPGSYFWSIQIQAIAAAEKSEASMTLATGIWIVNRRPIQLSNEKNLGWLGYIGDYLEDHPRTCK